MGGEFYQQTSRDILKDCEDMTAMLEENGWVVINGIVQRVKFTDVNFLRLGTNRWFDVEEGAASLFRAGENVNRRITTTPKKASPTPTYMTMPFVLLAKKTMRFGLTQVAGGNLVGVLQYE